MQADTLEIYGTADPEAYPLQKKGHTLEFLREKAHLRPRTATFGAILRIRSALAFAIHNFFREKGFFYLNTPLITASDCEGAGPRRACAAPRFAGCRTVRCPVRSWGSPAEIGRAHV